MIQPWRLRSGKNLVKDQKKEGEFALFFLA